ncbi:helical backbone metal receptor [Tellurirhabdus rosea]|uniref:helical backbone metal receptor n=1 Tax=Tellurirhabdus rosea TaxID=2674997 RepID=UPI00225C127B|nr:helical backbone metal receptor [Tellurirhabdus rosea]
MHPQRIISLVPSQTELLFDLGVEDRLVGLTKFCIHPADKVKLKTVVGGTKTLHMDRIHALRPDLILANKEENTREEIEELQRLYPVHVTDITTLEDALAMIRTVGGLVGASEKANGLAEVLAADFRKLSVAAAETAPRVAYFIWRKPWMAAAADTFIDHLLRAAGFRNAFAGQSRYPELTEADIRAARPDAVFLSSEPYPFGEKHRAELRALCPEAEILLVDGELFSWYGSRLRHSVAYFQELRHRLGLP